MRRRVQGVGRSGKSLKIRRIEVGRAKPASNLEGRAGFSGQPTSDQVLAVETIVNSPFRLVDGFIREGCRSSVRIGYRDASERASPDDVRALVLTK